MALSVKHSSNQLKSDNHRQSQIITRLQDYITRYGYELVDLPIIQPADLFLTKVGDELINKLFTFERFGQQLALRPEFTASAAFNFAQQKINRVVRWQFQGPIFIDDPNSFTHDYQRQSLGAELIGLGSSLADAEIIALAANGINNIGVKDWHLMLGHIGLIRQLLAYFKLDNRTERFLLNHLSAFRDEQSGKAFVIEQLERSLLSGSISANDFNQTSFSEEAPDQNMDYTTQEALGLLLDATQRGMTMGGRTRHDIARRLLQKHRRIADKQQILKAVDFLEIISGISHYPVAVALDKLEGFVQQYNPDAQAELENWREITKLLNVYDIPEDRIRIHPELVRGWDYYTGIVFELHSEDGVLLGGGGRYDELIALVGNCDSVPAVGFAYYLEDLMQRVSRDNIPTDVLYNLVINPQAEQQASWWAHQLRRHGLHVSLVAELTLGSEAITVDTDGQAIFGNKTYSKNEIELLASYLQQFQGLS